MRMGIFISKTKEEAFISFDENRQPGGVLLYPSPQVQSGLVPL